MAFAELIQSADFKLEKHAPVIEAADTVKAGELFDVTVSVGKEIAHPNTPQHYIAWIQLFFKPAGSKFAIEIGKYDFTAHAASMTDTPGPALSAPFATAKMQIAKSGTLLALSYCNLHGLWESSKEIVAE